MKPTLLTKIATGFAMALSAALLIIPDALATRYNYWVTNRSSSDITALYVSEYWRTDWGEDITGAYSLRSGNSMRLAFNNPSPNECLYDFKAVFASGDSLTRYEVNVCSAGSYGEFIYHD